MNTLDGVWQNFRLPLHPMSAKCSDIYCLFEQGGGRNKQNSRNSWGLGESQAAPWPASVRFLLLCAWSSVILNSLHLGGLPSLTPVGGVGPGEGRHNSGSS